MKQLLRPFTGVPGVGGTVKYNNESEREKQEDYNNFFYHDIAGRRLISPAAAETGEQSMLLT